MIFISYTPLEDLSFHLDIQSLLVKSIMKWDTPETPASTTLTYISISPFLSFPSLLLMTLPSSYFLISSFRSSISVGQVFDETWYAWLTYISISPFLSFLFLLITSASFYVYLYFHLSVSSNAELLKNLSFWRNLF